MYDRLFNALNGLNHFKTAITHIEMLLGLIEIDYLRNGEQSRTDAIDSICQILQSNKSPV